MGFEGGRPVGTMALGKPLHRGQAPLLLDQGIDQGFDLGLDRGSLRDSAAQGHGAESGLVPQDLLEPAQVVAHGEGLEHFPGQPMAEEVF